MTSHNALQSSLYFGLKVCCQGKFWKALNFLAIYIMVLHTALKEDGRKE